eukprot:12938789-Alexandrium_andersonii.AAC.1
MNFKRQKIEPQLFCHPGGARMAVHVDDPILAAKVEEMKPILRELAGWVLVKEGPVLSKYYRIKYLGFFYHRVPQGVKVTPPEGYVRDTLAIYGMEDCKPV